MIRVVRMERKINMNNNEFDSDSNRELDKDDKSFDKSEKRTILISTIICALPMLLGLLVYNKLPDQVGIHFGANGEVDSYASKPVAVFLLPLFLVVIQLVVAFSLKYDPKKMNQGSIIKTLSLWIVPVVSVVAQIITLFSALGYKINSGFIIVMLTGILFVVIGNYLPKCRQNYTLGIKLPWTLHDEDNWNKTHRLAGFVWIIGGLAVIVSCFLRAEAFILGPVVIIMIIIPSVYSFILYRSKKNA